MSKRGTIWIYWSITDGTNLAGSQKKGGYLLSSMRPLKRTSPWWPKTLKGASPDELEKMKQGRPFRNHESPSTLDTCINPTSNRSCSQCQMVMLLVMNPSHRRPRYQQDHSSLSFILIDTLLCFLSIHWLYCYSILDIFWAFPIGTSIQ